MKLSGLCMVICVAIFPAAVLGGTSSTASLENGPVSYFENNCARCHGSMGSSYGNGFGKGLSADALRKKVSEMAKGPGQAPISGIDLDAEVAFHQALISHQPFVAVTSIDDSMIKGEAITGSKISASAGKKNLAVKTDEYNWEISLLPGVKSSEVTVSSTLNDKSTSLAIGTAPFTSIAGISK